MYRKGPFGIFMNAAAMAAMLFTTSCAMVGAPDARNVNIPSPTLADSRKTALNERPDSVMYLPLGEDVLVPEVQGEDNFPSEMVGPFELRGETLAGALQLILADYDISLAFETQEGLTRRITVANLRGDLGKVVNQVCSLANLYCSYEDGTIVVKDTQTFTVTLPPLGTEDENEFLDDVAEGLGAILDGGAGATAGTATTTDPIVDPTTRTIVYSATQRTAEIASRYFQRLRANTAMIVFETYIWEVSLNSGNSTGIDWFKLAQFSKFNTGISINGSVGADFTNPINIGIPTASADFNGTTGDILSFLSQFGAVKTISQPQITVLSGSEAELRVADTQNYVSQIATTLDEGQATTSVSTDSVDTGFTLTIGSTWDKSTVYARVAINLTDVKQIDDFTFSDSGDDGGSTVIQLPQTSERQLSTQIRVRPGDSVLIAGLVRENDNYNTRGIGFMKPFLPDSRTAQTENLELVILLRPRVIVYTAANDKRYVDYAMKKHTVPGAGAERQSAFVSTDGAGQNVYAPVVDPVQEEIPAGMPAPLSANPVSNAPVMPAPAPIIPAAPVAPVTSSSLTPPHSPVTSAAPASSLAPSVAPSAGGRPSWESAPMAPTPILRDTGISPTVPVGDRFSRGSGFVSRNPEYPSVYDYNSGAAAPAAAPMPAPATPAPVSSSVQTFPVDAPAPAMPIYNNATSAPAVDNSQASGPSPYETYDYYTPGR